MERSLIVHISSKLGTLVGVYDTLSIWATPLALLPRAYVCESRCQDGSFCFFLSFSFFSSLFFSPFDYSFILLLFLVLHRHPPLQPPFIPIHQPERKTWKCPEREKASVSLWLQLLSMQAEECSRQQDNSNSPGNKCLTLKY